MMGPAGPATAVGAGAGALAYAASRGARAARTAARVTNAASPSFNPGSSGGYVKQGKKRKVKRKRAPALTKRQRIAVRAIAIKAPEPYHPVLDVVGQYMFPIQTSATFPCIPLAGFFGMTPTGLTTTGLTPQRVGYNILEGFPNTSLQAVLAGQPIMQIPDPSGTNVPKVYDFSDKPDYSDQYRFRHYVKWDMKVKNLSNSGARIDLYLVKANADTDVGPIQEFQALYDQRYIASNNVVAGGDPEEIPKQWDQFFYVAGANNRIWRQIRKTTIVLNPGDEADVSMSNVSTLHWRGRNSEVYQKGTWWLMARIQGTLDCDKTDLSQISMSGANIACKMTRHYSVKVQKSLFDAVMRRSPLVVGNVVTPVTAGDGNQMDLTM